MFWLVLLLLPGQLSRLVGGGMPPALQGITVKAEKEKRLCPLILRDKGAMFLCGTTLVPGMLPALASLYRANPVLLTWFQRTARRGYGSRAVFLPCTNRQFSGKQGTGRLSSS